MNHNSTVELVKTRDFGDVIGDAIKILKENFGSLSLGFLIYVLPVVLIGGYLFILYGSKFLQLFFNPGAAQELDDPTAILSGLGIFYIGFILAFIMLYMLIYGFCMAYEDMEEGEKVTVEDIGNQIKANFLKLIAIFLVLISLAILPMIAIGAFIGIAPGLAVLLILFFLFAYIYAFNVLQFVPYIFLREELGISDAIRRAFYLVKDKWWISFGIIIVASLIASFVSYIFAIPAYIMIFASAFSAMEGASSSSPGLMMSLAFLLMIIGSLFCSMYSVLAQVLQYYNLVELKESHRLEDRIDEIGNDPDSMFENDGEF
jgi:hypothetical protein